MNKPLLLLQGALLVAGTLVLAKPVYRLAHRQVCHLQARQLWQSHCANPPAIDPAGRPALWLRIPSCGFDDLVLSGDSPANLARHASVALESPTVILGHRDSHFRHLKDIRPDDAIEVETSTGESVSYRVTEIEVLPADRVDARIREHRDPTGIVLMTCYPFRYIGPAPERFLAWARLEAIKPDGTGKSRADVPGTTTIPPDGKDANPAGVEGVHSRSEIRSRVGKSFGTSTGTSSPASQYSARRRIV